MNIQLMCFLMLIYLMLENNLFRFIMYEEIIHKMISIDRNHRVLLMDRIILIIEDTCSLFLTVSNIILMRCFLGFSISIYFHIILDMRIFHQTRMMLFHENQMLT